MGKKEQLKPLSSKELKEKYPELAKMTVSQVVQSKVFEDKFNKAVNSLLNAREKVSKSLHDNSLNLRRTMLDRLDEHNLLDIDYFGPEYCLCLDKESRLSAEIRAAILHFGKQVYNDAIKELIKQYDNESKN